MVARPIRMRLVILAVSVVTLVASIPPAAAFAACGIEGTVVTKPGQPLAGIGVRAYLASSLWSNPDTAPSVTTLTDASGDYALTLPTEDYYVLAYVDTSSTYRDIAFPLSGRPLENSNAIAGSTGTTETLGDMPMLTVAELLAGRTHRVSGTDRYLTAAAISRLNFPYGADTVVIASGATFADALAASPLAGVYGAPILITPPAGLSPVIQAEIKRLDPNNAIIIGSGAAVSTGVEAQLSSLGLTDLQSTSRIQGNTRYETAEQIVYAMGALLGKREMPVALLCRGDSFADALSVSPHAYYRGCPIILTEPTTLNPAAGRALRYLGNNQKLKLYPIDWWFAVELTVVGGNSAITPDVMDRAGMELISSGNVRYWRLAGGTSDYPAYAADRYGTCAAVNEYFSYFGGPFDRVGIASGANFPDALSGGAALGAHGGALVLTPSTRLHPDSRTTLARNGRYVMDAQVFGAKNAVNDPTMSASRKAMGTSLYDIDAASHLVAASYVDIISSLSTQTRLIPGARSGRRVLPRPDLTGARPSAELRMSN